MARLFVDDSPLTTDIHSLASVSLHRSHEFDAALAMPVRADSKCVTGSLAGAASMG